MGGTPTDSTAVALRRHDGTVNQRLSRSGAPYQEVAAKARAQLEGLADRCATPAREAELIAIFKEATRLEADFWEMGWRAGQRVRDNS
jgi:thiaminase/transcriptional activator TenA